VTRTAAVEDSQLSPYSYSQARLIKIDPSSGSTGSFVADECGYEASEFTSSTSIIAATPGPISVGPDGSYCLQIGWESSVSWMVPVTIGNPSGLCALADTTYEMTTGTTSTQLATVSPAGSLSLADLPGSLVSNPAGVIYRRLAPAIGNYVSARKRKIAVAIAIVPVVIAGAEFAFSWGDNEQKARTTHLALPLRCAAEVLRKVTQPARPNPKKRRNTQTAAWRSTQ
jgi:hypothetical protein